MSRLTRGHELGRSPWVSSCRSGPGLKHSPPGFEPTQKKTTAKAPRGLCIRPPPPLLLSIRSRETKSLGRQGWDLNKKNNGLGNPTGAVCLPPAVHSTPPPHPPIDQEPRPARVADHPNDSFYYGCFLTIPTT